MGVRYNKGLFFDMVVCYAIPKIKAADVAVGIGVWMSPWGLLMFLAWRRWEGLEGRFA